MLGLACSTHPEWAQRALGGLERVLVDHAHCEMKAASNAIALSARCLDYPEVVRALVDLAEEEIQHFRRVFDEIQRRGLKLDPPSEDFYVAELRRRAHATGRDKSASGAIADRLLVGSLIEARSCERFKLLAAALREAAGAASASRETSEEHLQLANFYDELFAAEARHHRTFIDLAEKVVGDTERVHARLEALAQIEAEVVKSLHGDTTIHG